MSEHGAHCGQTLPHEARAVPPHAAEPVPIDDHRPQGERRMSEPLHTAEIVARPGDVVRYAPDPSRHDPRWCREGMAIADERGILFDTYWGSGGDNHRLNAVEVATAEVIFNVADYDELDRYARASRGIWETYHPDDRRVLTSQHGLQRRWFIRKGADPDMATQVASAEEKVLEAEEAVASAQRRAEWAREELADLRATTDPEGA